MRIIYYNISFLFDVYLWTKTLIKILKDYCKLYWCLMDYQKCYKLYMWALWEALAYNLSISTWSNSFLIPNADMGCVIASFYIMLTKRKQVETTRLNIVCIWFCSCVPTST